MSCVLPHCVRRVLSGALLLWLSGCGSVSLSPAMRRELSTVSIAREPEAVAEYSGNLPDLPVPTPGSRWYAAWITAPLGIVEDLFSLSETAERRSRALERRMRQEGIELGPIVRREFARGLSNAESFPRVRERGGDAEFRLRVRYGIDDGFGLRGTWKPWVEVEGRLVDPEERVLWANRAAVGADDARLPEFHEPFRKPELLRHAFVRAARIAAEELVRDLRAG